MRRSLVHIYGPQGVLPAAAAIRWYGLQKQQDEKAEVCVLLHMPGWDERRLSSVVPLVNQLISSQRWASPLFFTQEQVDRVVQGQNNLNDQALLQRFRTALGLQEGSIDEVYYSHDVCGPVAQLCMRSFPQATRVTFGEALGTLEDKEYLMAAALGQGWDEEARRLKPRTVEPQATKAVLILPADQTGDCLDGKELFVVPKQLVLQVISEFEQATPELREYSNYLLSSHPEPYYFFILGNTTDSNFTSANDEVAMYEEMVRTHIPMGATIFIKGHPLASLPVDAMLTQRLKNDYRPETLSAKYGRYPTEMWETLLGRCQVMAMSYCSISLQYLYGRPVIHALNEELIRKYMRERCWTRLLEGDKCYRKQLDALKNWDGKGVLYTGKRVNFPPANAQKAPLPQAEDNRQSAERKNQEGVSLFQAGKGEEALKLLQEAQQLAPEQPIINTNLAVVYWNLGKAQEAIVYFSMARLLAPNDRTAVLNLHQVLMSTGQAGAAHASGLAYLQQNPGDEEVRTLLNTFPK